MFSMLLAEARSSYALCTIPILPLMHYMSFSYLTGNLYMVHRLAPSAAGLVDYAFLGQLVTQMLENSSSQYLMLSKWKWARYVLLVMVLFAYLVMHSDVEKPFSGCLAFKCWRKTYNCFWWYLGCFIFWYGCQVLSRFTCRACCKACCEGGV